MEKRSPENPEQAWTEYVVPSLGAAAARKLKGPHRLLGEGRDSFALSAKFHGRDVAVKVIFHETDYLFAQSVLEAGRLEGVAQVLGIGQWISTGPYTGYGAIVQERVWTPAQIQGSKSPFSSKEANRLMRAVEDLDQGYVEPMWPDVRQDPFYQDIDVGLDELYGIVRNEWGQEPVVADLHAHNVGLVEREGTHAAVILDFGVVQGS